MGKIKKIAILIFISMALSACGDKYDNRQNTALASAETEEKEYLDGYEWHYEVAVKKEKTPTEIYCQNLMGKEFRESVTPASQNEIVTGIPIFEEQKLTYGDNVVSVLNCMPTRLLWFINRVDFSAMGYITQRYPTNALRLRDENTVYGIYQTDTGYRFYVFFDRATGMPIGYPVLLREMHSIKEFGNISVGTDIAEVEAIDGVASIYKKAAIEMYRLGGLRTVRHILTEKEYLEKGLELPKEEKPVRDVTDKSEYDETEDMLEVQLVLSKKGAFVSLHYLKEGLLRIEYEILTDESIRVTDVSFREDYCVVDCDIAYNERLLPMDCPADK